MKHNLYYVTAEDLRAIREAQEEFAAAKLNLDTASAKLSAALAGVVPVPESKEQTP